ncbi:MAG: LppU/SCO3897 family protein [Sporichthyaceae bacterium]
MTSDAASGPGAPAPKRFRTAFFAALLAVALLIPGNVLAAVGLSGDEFTYQYTELTPPATTGLDDEEGTCREVGEISAEKDRAGASDAELFTAPCADPDAVYIVYKRLEGDFAKCPRGDYIEYFSVVTSGSATPFKECLGYNMRPGECFISTPNGVVRTDCRRPHRPETLMVVAVHDGTSPAPCRKKKAVAYFYPDSGRAAPDPGRVMCIKALS